MEPVPAAEGPPEAAAAEEAPVVEKPKKEPKKPRKRPSYEMKLFETYDLTEVEIHDAGLAKYINLSPIVIPHTGGRWANKPFGKAKANLVERLINNMMRTENYTGKKAKSYRVVRTAFEIIASGRASIPCKSSWTRSRKRPRGRKSPGCGSAASRCHGPWTSRRRGDSTWPCGTSARGPCRPRSRTASPLRNVSRTKSSWRRKVTCRARRSRRRKSSSESRHPPDDSLRGPKV